MGVNSRFTFLKKTKQKQGLETQEESQNSEAALTQIFAKNVLSGV